MRPLLLSASLMLLASAAWADPSASLEGPTAGWRHDGLLERSADARVAYPTPPIDRGGQRGRSLITLAALTALKCPQELKGHVRGALNNGCTVEEIRETLLHCAVYAGVPASIDAFRAAQEVIDDYQRNAS